MDLNKLDKDIEMYKEGIERTINEDIPRVERQIYEIESGMGIYGPKSELTEEDIKDDPIYLENKAKVEKENENIKLHKNAAKHNIEQVISLLKEKNQQLYDEFLSKKAIQNQQKLDQLKTVNTKLDFDKQHNEAKIEQKLQLIEKYKEIGDTDRVSELYQQLEELKQTRKGIEEEQNNNNLEISLLENDAEKAKNMYNQNLKDIANYRKLAKDNGIKLEEPKVETKVDPTKVDPAKVDPAKVDPAKVDPAKVDPAKVDPAKVDPTKVDPTKVDPAKVDPAKVDPAKVDPAKVDPAKVDPAKVDPKLVGKIDLKDVKIIIGKKGMTIQAPGLNKEKGLDEVKLNLKELYALNDEADYWIERISGKKLTEEQLDKVDPNILIALTTLYNSDIDKEVKQEILSRYAEAITNEGKVPKEKSLKSVIEYDRTDLDYLKPRNLLSRIIHKKQFDEMKYYADVAEEAGIADVKQDKPGWIRNLVSNMKNKVKLLGTGNEDRLENTEEYQNATRREKKLLKEAEKHRNKTKDVVTTHTSITEKNGKIKTTTYELKKDGELKKENPFKKGLENLKAKAESNKPHSEKVVESDGDVLEKSAEEEVK